MTMTAQAVTTQVLTETGQFAVGCNYWASHAGTRMWADWQSEIVATDLQRLQQAGLQVLRVFPLWPDFQPISLLRSAHNRPIEMRHGEAPLPDDPCGQAGMSVEAMGHFADFLDLMAAQDLRCIVGLLTGWMSGRLFVPPALDGLNVMTDPLALRWELRFVRHFVSTFRAHPAIIGWDLGNECNCMGPTTQDQAYTWAATIAAAIRAADPTRPVVSGMHSLSPHGAWSIQDQGEITDVLTTHPYPIFTPHADQDPINTLRTLLHGTAESRLYADISGKPCLCQETGTLGPMIASEAIAADFAKSCLFSLWANDCHGMLWWCANDQGHLDHAPYDWCTVERELGLLRRDGTAKPVLGVMHDFRDFLAGLPFPRLPLRQREAVCILTPDQDHWGTAYSTFILAKQAGFDLEFQYADQPLKPAELYLMPNLSGYFSMPRRRWPALLARVAAGATLYLSLHDALLSEFEPLTGLCPQTRARRGNWGEADIATPLGAASVPLGGNFEVQFAPTHAAVLAATPDGNPLFTRAPYGQGAVYFLGTPLEHLLTHTPSVFAHSTAWRLYHLLAAPLLARRVLRKTHPLLAVTEHPISSEEKLIIAANLSPTPLDEELCLQPGWTVTNIYRGEAVAPLRLPAHEAVVLRVRREGGIA